MKDPIPANEVERLAELHRYSIMATPPEVAFDRITQLAARLFRTPIALLNFIADDLQWFKSCVGMQIGETPREASICNWAILSDEVMVVPDARADDRFSSNCFVAAENGIRFYAGAPLVTPRGYILGTLCVIDSVPRPEGLTNDEKQTLRDLADLVMSELALRISGRETEAARAAERESQQRFQDAFAHAPIGMVLTDLAGYVVLSNEAYRRITGYSKDELPTIRFLSLTHPDEVENNVKLFSQLVAGELESYVLEKRIVCKCGDVLWVRAAATLLRDSLGNPTHTVGLVEDISARKLGEDRLLQSQQDLKTARDLLQTTLASIGDGVVATDCTGKVTFMNLAAQRLTGWSGQDAIGVSLQEVFRIVNETTRTVVPNPVEKALRDGVIVGQTNHTMLLARDGREISVDDSAAPICGPNGEVAGGVLVFRDITERRLAEKALEESDARFRAAVQAVSDIIWTNNANGEMEGWQQGWGEYTGQTQEEYQGYGWSTAVHPDDVAPTIEEWQSAVSERRTAVFEHRVRRHDGQYRLFGVRAVPVFRMDGTVREWVGVHTDITERRKAEMERAASIKVLRRSNDDLQQFAHAASHDLRSPLRTVNSMTALLARRYTGRLDAEADELIGFITTGMERMDTLISDLLTFSNASEFENAPKRIRMADALAGALTNLQSAIEECGAVVIAGQLPVVLAHESPILQVFQNLIGNALKYRSERPVRIHVSTYRDSTEWVVRVEDNGIGFEPRYATEVFRAFRRLHGHEISGSGIGLATCKRVVERYGGRIWAESEPGVGSIFSFTIPGSENEALT